MVCSAFEGVELDFGGKDVGGRSHFLIHFEGESGADVA